MTSGPTAQGCLCYQKDLKCWLRSEIIVSRSHLHRQFYKLNLSSKILTIVYIRLRFVKSQSRFMFVYPTIIEKERERELSVFIQYVRGRGLGATFRKTSKWICADQRNRRRHNENDHTLSGDFHRQDQRQSGATYRGDTALLDKRSKRYYIRTTDNN